jgi:glycosyltransferase involved in cell wall biosynthesis
MPVSAAGPPPGRARSLLLVAQLSPPSTLSAARRVAGLVKYLGRLGHRVTLLTSTSSGSGPVEGAARVVRARDLLVSPLNWRRASFQSLAGGGNGYAAEPSALASLVPPDLAMVGWVPFALPRSLALHREERFDCVLTTSPPHSGHLVGLALHARGVPWVADFRDGWTFESDRPDWALPGGTALDSALERRVARTADRLVAVSDPISEDLRARFGRPVATITNGFDPEEHSDEALGAPAPAVCAERVTLLHAGRMAYAGRSPAPLLEAVAGDPGLAGRVELLFAGPLSAQERELIEGSGLGGAARAVGSLDRPSVLALERRADALLILTSGRRRGEVTQKVFEYLAAGKPVVVLGEGSEAARIVSEAGAGPVTSAGDPDRIAACLRDLVGRLDGEGGGGSPDPQRVERFSYANLAAAVAEELDAAVSGSG